MAKTRASPFRSALQVTPARLSLFDDADLQDLMRELLHAQAYRCGAAVNQISVNTQGQAKDDGCDGWSPAPSATDVWLGSSATCWQFKAGKSGEASKIPGEVTKPIPNATLQASGRFVLVATGSTNGKKGTDDRLKALTDAATAAGLPSSAIEVFGSEKLATWCNQHPAIASRWAGNPDGLWRLDDWLRNEVHQVPWHPTAELSAQVARLRSELDFRGGSLWHLHVEGKPGVGKSRFALELCRDAAWKHMVVYIRQAGDHRIDELIDGVTAQSDAEIVVAIDEVPRDRIINWRDAIDRGNGRVRLITIGEGPTRDSARVPAIAIKPLPPELMSSVVRSWHPGIPLEHVEYVVRFADGYMRLARLVADYVKKNPATDVRGILQVRHIRQFLDDMFDASDRRALYVVAVLSSVGWTDDMESEARAIAQHLNVPWGDVLYHVEQLDRRFGIAPRGGRLRYISPTPLGNYLAIEAWETYPDLLLSLPGVLPTERAQKAYNDRLRTIASTPRVRDISIEELRGFFRLSDFVDLSSVRRWAALSAADPMLAARLVREALESASLEARTEIPEQSRRDLVWMLNRLAWRKSSFADATLALALLAEVEQDGWANNATEEFTGKYLIALGGTSVPYLDRLTLLDSFLVAHRPTLFRLVVRALLSSCNLHEGRMGVDPVSDDLPEPEWHPATALEHAECLRTALQRLSDLAQKARPEVEGDFKGNVERLGLLLREMPVHGETVTLFRSIADGYPRLKEKLREEVADILRRDAKYTHALSPTEIATLSKLEEDLRDPSLLGRVRQEVGQYARGRETVHDFAALADELVGDPAALAASWPWLTSGEAHDAWNFGEALAIADVRGTLDDLFTTLPARGNDLRLLSGYLHRRQEQRGSAWVDAWMLQELARDPSDARLLVEVMCRTRGTPTLVRELIRMLRSQTIPDQVAGMMEFGLWADDLPADSLQSLLEALLDGGGTAIAIGLLEQRLKARPEESEHWHPLALVLATRPELVRSFGTTGYEWKLVAERLIPQHVPELAAAILHEHHTRTARHWFLDHTDAHEVLGKCVAADPASVWQSLRERLESAEGYSYGIGFPRGILDQMPREAVLTWIAGNPKDRAPLTARFVVKDLSHDASLAAEVLGRFGDDEDVGRAFLSAYLSGSWSGPVSEHWKEIAARLSETEQRTKLPRLKTWALGATRSLLEMAESERQREDEERVQRGF
ncbi:MAG: hypothetical protein Q8M65_02205 [Rhodoglobus sp.]|nr:hypothetical protein [Rhodoglobus sp.]